MTTGPLSQCGTCQRLRSPFAPEATGQTGPWCEAFPTGIPEAIYDNTTDHRQPVEGDHGLQWVAREGATYPTIYLPGDTMTAATPPDHDQPHTGVMIALVPTPDDATRLATDDEGALPAEELHVTLAYLGDTADLAPNASADLAALAEQLATGTSQIVADAFGIALVNPIGDEPCVVLLLNSDELADLHAEVTNTLHAAQIDTTASKRPWLAHLTLAYTDDHYAPADLVDRTGPVTFDRLRLAVGPDTTDYPLAAPAPMVEAPPVEGP
ncbi:MAG: 2'-5' RNA ligase family protein [Chromatiaceae bacterium]